MALPDSVQSTAYTAIVNILQADPVLSANLKTLMTWTGEEPISASSDNTPYVRLTPAPAPGQRWNSTTFVPEPLLIEVETAVEGQDVRAAMDLWEAIMRALFPTDQADFVVVWGQLAAAGVKLITPVQGSATVKKDATGLYVTGKGSLKVDLALVLKNYGPAC